MAQCEREREREREVEGGLDKTEAEQTVEAMNGGLEHIGLFSALYFTTTSLCGHVMKR